MQAVDRCIREHLHSEVVLVNQIAEYIVGNGGKRLRPLLALMAARACNNQSTHHFTLAAVVEMIHTSTLLHDDVVDESGMRRGQKTANAVFGNAAAVLVGDFLYSRSFQMMVSIGSMRVQEILADATNLIAEGEVLQLMNIGDTDITVDAYLQVIRYKTAKLFEASARLGAVVAGATDAVEDGLARYGMHLGTAFQIIDDVLDYSGNAGDIGKNVGDDLSEGKLTLPVIYALQRAPEAEVPQLKELIAAGNLEVMPRLMSLMDETGAIASAREVAEGEVRLAMDAIAQLPDSETKQHLAALTRIAVDRQS
ncbi:polyprenyl synthetase family protein [Leeia sp. TBRC 13508]|uniref:Polyprenyl synthetase family protein n=1 Tax=Leeia speluncae TaxID=2884804 RepID=A0ABS8D725_9NEIS|nr:polyprenyl synthetase family protein [Leeia speluncae]MCB6183982.1 polyprenyl synthetase family protein [Leeia speluncae]